MLITKTKQNTKKREKNKTKQEKKMHIGNKGKKYQNCY